MKQNSISSVYYLPRVPSIYLRVLDVIESLVVVVDPCIMTRKYSNRMITWIAKIDRI